MIEQLYCSTCVSFCQAGKEKKLKIYFKSRHGREFRLEGKPREPMEIERFYTLAALVVIAMILTAMLLHEVLK